MSCQEILLKPSQMSNVLHTPFLSHLSNWQRKWVLVKFKTNLPSSARHTMSQLHIVCSSGEILLICRLKNPRIPAGHLCSWWCAYTTTISDPTAPQWIKGKSLWSPNQIPLKIGNSKVKYDFDHIYTVCWYSVSRSLDNLNPSHCINSFI